MTEDKFGTNEIKDFLTFGFVLADAVIKITEDGDYDWIDDSITAIKALIKAPEAFNETKLLIKQLGEISEEEKLDLIFWAGKEFDIADDGIEDIIEDAISMVISFLSMINKVKEVRNG